MARFVRRPVLLALALSWVVAPASVHAQRTLGDAELDQARPVHPEQAYPEPTRP